MRRRPPDDGAPHLPPWSADWDDLDGDADMGWAVGDAPNPTRTQAQPAPPSRSAQRPSARPAREARPRPASPAPLRRPVGSVGATDDAAGAGPQRPPKMPAGTPTGQKAPPRGNAPAPDAPAIPGDDTLRAIAHDALTTARDDAAQWWQSRGGNTLKVLLGVTTVFVLVAVACSILSAIQPTIATHGATDAKGSASTATTATPHSGGAYVGTVDVDYVAGHATAFSVTVTIAATLYWATTNPATFTCGRHTFKFPYYWRPQFITCTLTLPPGATGVAAEQFQSCQTFSDANATAVCWDNPKAFHPA